MALRVAEAELRALRHLRSEELERSAADSAGTAAASAVAASALRDECAALRRAEAAATQVRVCMRVCMRVCVYVCMYVCMRI